jgi:hypothetical protein
MTILGVILCAEFKKSHSQRLKMLTWICYKKNRHVNLVKNVALKRAVGIRKVISRSVFTWVKSFDLEPEVVKETVALAKFSLATYSYMVLQCSLDIVILQGRVSLY